MLRLQDGEVIYNNSNVIGNVEDMNYLKGGFCINLPDNTFVFIPEENCTTSEAEVFQAYHEYYKDTGGVKPIPQPDIEEIRNRVIEAMNQECSKRIISGFKSKAFDGETEKYYDCELTDQARISGLVSIAQLRIAGLSTEVIKWKATGELECYEWTPEQMLVLGLDLKKHIEEQTDRFYALRKYALDETLTIEELEAITWDMKFD